VELEHARAPIPIGRLIDERSADRRDPCRCGVDIREADGSAVKSENAKILRSYLRRRKRR